MVYYCQGIHSVRGAYAALTLDSVDDLLDEFSLLLDPGIAFVESD